MNVFDIETAPLPIETLENLKPEFTANRTLKDPDKIRADIEAKRQAYIDNAALDATTAQIVAIGTTGGMATVNCMFQDDGGEAALIGRFWDWLAQELFASKKVAGFSIFNFDLPVLVRRSYILGIKVPPVIRRGRYWNDLLVDLQDLWTLGNREQVISLDRLSKVLGVGAKTGSGADFHKLLATDKQLAIEYLTNDLNLTRKCAEVMIGKGE